MWSSLTTILRTVLQQLRQFPLLVSRRAFHIHTSSLNSATVGLSCVLLVVPSPVMHFTYRLECTDKSSSPRMTLNPQAHGNPGPMRSSHPPIRSVFPFGSVSATGNSGGHEYRACCPIRHLQHERTVQSTRYKSRQTWSSRKKLVFLLTISIYQYLTYDC